jgi:hypothetical protein
LALSQWGLWADECDEEILGRLAESYVARKRWEAELQAGHMVRYLGTAMGSEPQGYYPQGVDPGRIPASAMLAMLGGFN